MPVLCLFTHCIGFTIHHDSINSVIETISFEIPKRRRYPTSVKRITYTISLHILLACHGDVFHMSRTCRCPNSSNPFMHKLPNGVETCLKNSEESKMLRDRRTNWPGTHSKCVCWHACIIGVRPEKSPVCTIIGSLKLPAADAAVLVAKPVPNNIVRRVDTVPAA